MNYSTRKNLLLPDGDELYQRSHQNDNMNIIDDLAYATGHNIIEYGAVSGSGDDRTAFSDTDTAAGSEPIIVPQGSWSIQSNITISSHVMLEPGALIDIADGVTVTLSAGISCRDGDLTQHFSRTTTGTIAFGAGYNPTLKPEWFGARGDASTASASGIQWTLDILKAAGGGKMSLSNGTYLCAVAILIDSSDIIIEGVGAKSVLRFTNATNGIYTDDSQVLTSILFRNFKMEAGAACLSAFYLDGTTYTNTYIYFEGIHFGRATGPDFWAYGINALNTLDCMVNSADIQACDTGIYLHNYSNDWDIISTNILGGSYGVYADAAGCMILGGVMQANITVAAIYCSSQGMSIIGTWFEISSVAGVAIEVASSQDGLLISGCKGISVTGTNSVVLGVAASGQHSNGIQITGNAFGPGKLVINDECEGTIVMSNRFHSTGQITNNGVASFIYGNYKYDGTAYTNDIDGALVLSGANQQDAGSLTINSGVQFTAYEIYAPDGIRIPHFTKPIDDDLLWELQLEEGAGSNAFDSSPNDWDATITGGTWGTGSFGNRTLTLDGSTDRITIADNVANRPGSSDFTMEILIAFNSDTGGIITKGGDNWHDGNFQFIKETSTLVCVYGSATEIGTYANSRMAVPIDGSFVHVAIVKSGTAHYGYVNGVLSAYDANFYDVGVFDSSDNWVIGNINNGALGLSCEVAWARVYLRALTEQEIENHWLRRAQPSIVYNDNFRVVGSDGAVDFQVIDGVVTVATWTQYDIIHASQLIPEPDGSDNVGVVYEGFDLTDYYEYKSWTPNDADDDMDFWANWVIPGDFASFPSNAITCKSESTDAAESTCNITMYEADKTVDATISGSDISADSDNTLKSTSLTPGGSYSPGDVITFKIHVAQTDVGDITYVGPIKIAYNANK